MSRPPSLSGAAETPYALAVYTWVMERNFTPVAVDQHWIAGRFPGEQAVSVVAELADGIVEMLAELCGRIGQDGTRIVLFGGSCAVATQLKETLPWTSGAMILAWHVDDGGIANPIAPGACRLADSLAAPRTPGAADWEGFWQRVHGQAKARRVEQEGFIKGISGRSPNATRALTGLILGVFVLELFTGAPDFPPALYRLGALDGDAVRQGELWRLVSHAFLHGSLLHFAVNAWVLWSLGGSLEKILGTQRFLVLYTGSVVSGACLSVVALNGRSVGASGALWGMIAAMAVLAWRTRGIFPEEALTRLRRAAIQNLGINVAVSFLPGVDWAAHAGGGLMGFFLLGTGLLTIGLPRWAREPDVPDRIPTFVSALAGLSALVLVASPAIAIGTGGVNALKEPALRQHQTLASSWTLMLPDSTGPAAMVALAGESEESFGDLGRDAAVLAVVTSPFDTAPTAEEVQLLKQTLQESVADLGEDWRVSREFTWREVEGAPMIVGAFRSESEVSIQRAAVIRPEGLCRVDAVVWDAAGVAWRDVAADVARDCKPPALP